MFLMKSEDFTAERREWHKASEKAFVRVWDKEHDAIYDNFSFDTELLWIEEAERRLKEIQEGTATCRPAEDVLRDVRAKLKKAK
jgi:hypothetical protein